MDSVSIILLAIALAMDAFAVSITCGLQNNNAKFKDAIKVALFFGFFQALMPTIGFYSGSNIPFDITVIDHWIAFILLAFIGIHMIMDSLKNDDVYKRDLLKTKTLFLAAIATSIDALAAGFSLSILNTGIKLLILSTGIITALLSFIGVKIGKRIGLVFEHRMELVSGIILILIGCKILFDHLIGFQL